MSEKQRQRIRSTRRRFAAAMLALSLLAPAGAGAAAFEDVRSDVLGTYDGVEYVLYTGRFTGTTAQGAYRMPFEIVAPADPAEGNGRVLFEPPHFVYGAAARLGVIGPELLFGRGFSHATVGFGDWGFNRLDLAAPDLEVAGAPAGLVPPLDISAPVIIDIEILDQFTRALTADPMAAEMLGDVSHLHAYGISQTAQAMLELLYFYDVPGRFDFTLLHLVVWNLPFGRPEWATLPVPFVPFDGSDKTIFVETEGDQLISDSVVIRGALAYPEYRLWEVAGSAHLPLSGPVPGLPPGLPLSFNSLDNLLVARAAFFAGDDWAARGIEPPPSVTLGRDASGAPDPVYGFPTGIARDANGNATGGVRLPSLAVGAYQYIASLPAYLGIPPSGSNLFFSLAGAQVDLTCTPPSRFRNHGQYVRAFGEAVRALRKGRYLLPGDAENLLEAAAESAVGKPGSCEVLP